MKEKPLLSIKDVSILFKGYSVSVDDDIFSTKVFKVVLTIAFYLLFSDLCKCIVYIKLMMMMSVIVF